MTSKDMSVQVKNGIDDREETLATIAIIYLVEFASLIPGQIM